MVIGLRTGRVRSAVHVERIHVQQRPQLLKTAMKATDLHVSPQLRIAAIIAHHLVSTLLHRVPSIATVPSAAAERHVPQPRVAVHRVAAPVAIQVLLAASVLPAVAVQVPPAAAPALPVVAVEHLAVAVAVPLAAVADISEAAGN